MSLTYILRNATFLRFVTLLLLLYYIYVTILLQFYINIIFFFPFAPIPLIPLLPSLNSPSISFIVKNFFSSVIATLSATINGSIKSINILAGDDAKFAPAKINPS